MIIELNGQKYEISNWDSFKNKLLNAIGAELEAEVLKEVDKMRLIGTGALRTGFSYEVKGDSVILSNSEPYAAYLEYGTFSYWNKFGLDNFPIPGYPSIPKKKELKLKQRQGLPKGMQPFAFFRRVFFNKERLGRVVSKSAKRASS